jgi:UDP-3-O-[3-hydroxymyristoyl] glucosamine N-acyltransferase
MYGEEHGGGDAGPAERDANGLQRVRLEALTWNRISTAMKLREIADLLGCRLEGDGEIEITGVAGMEHAGAGQLTFLANPKYAPKVKHTKASAIIVHAPIPGLGIAALVASDPYLEFARALALFYQPPCPAPGVHPLAYMAPSAVVGENCSIGPFAVVGERVRIGRNAVIHPHVVLYEGVEIGDDFLAHAHASVREFCRIGSRVTLQNGVVVGGDGFGFAKRPDGTHMKIVQSGVTVIEDDVEIQALSAMDRATVGETRVKRGAKIDNLVQVGHACTVGEDNIICSQTGLAGSTVLEKNVLLAGQVGSSGHLTVHEGAIVYAQSGIGGDVEANSLISGSPAFPAAEWRRSVTLFPRLAEMQKTIRELKKKVEELQKHAGTTPA